MKRCENEVSAFLAANAERMRLAPEPAEAVLWEHLRPLGFRRQEPIHGKTKNGGDWRYVLDFVKISRWFEGGLGLCVEVDGSSHRKKKGRDRRRDTRLATIGIKTLRFSNREVLCDTAGVIERIREAMNDGN